MIKIAAYLSFAERVFVRSPLLRVDAVLLFHGRSPVALLCETSLAGFQNQSVTSLKGGGGGGALRSCVWVSVSRKGQQRQGASFMSTSLSFNNQTMMDYLNTHIHLETAQG